MEIPSELEIEKIAQSPKGIIIEFSKIPDITFNAKNISDSTLKGSIHSRHIFNSINIIHSIWDTIDAEKVNFYTSDIKDCAFTKSHFASCNFDGAAHINNHIRECQFDDCSFKQTAITDSEFIQTKFFDCDLTDVIISTCKFSQCTFVRCKTSNKIIESSLVLDCIFTETDIQIETIIENFGLNYDCLIGSRVARNGRDELFSSKELSLLPQDGYTDIERFLIRYFLQPTILIEGSDEIDATFEFTNWLDLSKNPNRFRLLVERYHEFLMHNYEKDLLPFWMILKFHKMTFELSEKIDPVSMSETYRSIMGVHMSLSRLVEVYLRLCSGLLEAHSQNHEIVLLVNGPINPEYYYSELPELFKSGMVKIQKVIKHNSPNELHLVWDQIQALLPIISIVLATKVKFGIQQLLLSKEYIKEIAQEKAHTQLMSASKIMSSEAIDLIKTELGFDTNVNNYMFKLRAILPGNLLLNLQIELRTNILGKVRKIILDILPKSALKPGNDA